MSIFIGVGSNIEPEVNILKALDLLAEQVKVIATSNFYLTKPIGNLDQDPYYNGVWEIETELAPAILKFAVLRKVEENCGRSQSTDRYAPRKIDLDLLLYHNETITSPELRLPDPDIYQRDFIAFPLFEMKPELLIPDTKTSINAIISGMNKHDMELLVGFTVRIQKKINQCSH